MEGKAGVGFVEVPKIDNMLSMGLGIIRSIGHVTLREVQSAS